MASLVTLVMLLASLLGLGYAPSTHLSKKYAVDPWEQSFNKSANVSQSKCEEHRWSEPNKSEASPQIKYQAVAWADIPF
jgi:hypothetical protein